MELSCERTFGSWWLGVGDNGCVRRRWVNEGCELDWKGKCPPKDWTASIMSVVVK